MIRVKPKIPSPLPIRYLYKTSRLLILEWMLSIELKDRAKAIRSIGIDCMIVWWFFHTNLQIRHFLSVGSMCIFIICVLCFEFVLLVLYQCIFSCLWSCCKRTESARTSKIEKKSAAHKCNIWAMLALELLCCTFLCCPAGVQTLLFPHFGLSAQHGTPLPSTLRQEHLWPREEQTH